jgi:hypothetical protein
MVLLTLVCGCTTPPVVEPDVTATTSKPTIQATQTTTTIRETTTTQKKKIILTTTTLKPAPMETTLMKTTTLKKRIEPEDKSTSTTLEAVNMSATQEAVNMSTVIDTSVCPPEEHPAGRCMPSIECCVMGNFSESTSYLTTACEGDGPGGIGACCIPE